MAAARILSIYDGFFLGGARIAHTALICHLQAHFAPHHEVLGLTDRVVRENTLQLAVETIPYQRLMASAIPTAALSREGAHPLYGDQLSLVEKALRGADLHFFLKEQPLDTLQDLPLGERPLVVALHRTDPEHQGPGAERLARLSQEGLLTRAIACAESGKQAYAAFGLREEDITVIPNGVDLEAYREDALLREGTRGLLGIPQDAPVVLLAARLSEEKNVPLFLQAAKRFLKARPDAHFLMCGAGMHQENEVFKLLVEEEMGAKADAVHGLGIQSHMNALYNATDLVALTSTEEAGPLCLLEGMAAGAVPVSTDTGDVRLMVRDSSLITSFDPQEVATTWEAAYEGRLAHKQVILTFREELSDEVNFQAHAALFDGILAS